MDTAQSTSSIRPPNASETATYKSGVRADGLQKEAIFGVIITLVGLALCFMGGAIIIGIPFIIIGIITINMTNGCWEAICPYCGNKISLPFLREEKGPRGFNCPACKDRLLFKDGIVSTIAHSAANGHKSEPTPQKPMQSKAPQPTQNFSMEEQGFDFHDYSTYSAWCAENEHEPMSSAQFEQISSKGQDFKIVKIAESQAQTKKPTTWLIWLIGLLCFMFLIELGSKSSTTSTHIATSIDKNHGYSNTDASWLKANGVDPMEARIIEDACGAACK